MDNQQLTLVILAILGIAFGVATYVKAKRGEKFDLDTFLEDFAETAVSISIDALSVLKIDRDKFETEEEFNEALIQIIAKNFKDFLINGAEVPSNIMARITDDDIVTFIEMVFKFYDAQIRQSAKYEIVDTEDSIEEDLDIEEDDSSKEEVINAINGFYDEK